MINTSKIFRFRNFQAHKDARKFNRELRVLTRSSFPASERFGLLPQLWRALDSIILNIAEGADRSTDKDFALFLNRARTSLNEVIACLDIALDNKYISQEQHSLWLNRAAALAQQITAFRASLLRSK